MTAAVAVVPETPGDEVEDGKFLTYHGERFRMHPEGVSEFAQLELAEAITSGVTDVSELAAMLRLVIDGVHEEDQLRFRAACRKHRATVAELSTLISEGTVGDERPTEAPASSSSGRTSTEPKSASSSAASVTELRTQRPDLVRAVQIVEDARGA